MKDFLQHYLRDVIVMGRANVDLYVAESRDSLAQSMLFEKSVGGSAANIAVGLACLDRSVELLSKVSQDPFGDFVVEFLQQHGVGTKYLDKDDSGSRTSLAFAERKAHNSQVLFYRNNASDLLLTIDDVPEKALSETAVLVITGTGLSASPSREATLFAMEQAITAGTKTVFDLDWRPSSWESTQSAGLFYRLAAERANIIIGTHEEAAVLHGMNIPNEQDMVKRFLTDTSELFVVKRGSEGSTAYAADGQTWKAGIFPVSVQKNYGAGDAFAAAFIHGLLEGENPGEAMRLGAGAAALVVSNRSCAASMPTRKQLNDFIATKEKTSNAPSH